MKTLLLLKVPPVAMARGLPYIHPGWSRIVAAEDIARARTLSKDCAIATYLPDGRRVSDVLDLMPEGRRKEAFERKHSLGFVHISYVNDGTLTPLTPVKA